MFSFFAGWGLKATLKDCGVTLNCLDLRVLELWNFGGKSSVTWPCLTEKFLSMDGCQVGIFGEVFLEGEVFLVNLLSSMDTDNIVFSEMKAGVG